MEYADIKTVEDLEKWSGERYDELYNHSTPFALYGNDYSIGWGGWVSQERYEDTLPSHKEQLMFSAFNNCFEDREGLVKHLNDEQYLTNAMEEAFDDDAEIFITDTPDELSEDNIQLLKEECPERFDFDGQLFKMDPDYYKAGLQFKLNKKTYELTADKDSVTGNLTVSCYAVDRRGLPEVAKVTEGNPRRSKNPLDSSMGSVENSISTTETHLKPHRIENTGI